MAYPPKSNAKCSIGHGLEYSIWSAKISWCDTCKKHFYGEPSDQGLQDCEDGKEVRRTPSEPKSLANASKEDLIAVIAELAEALDGLASLGRKDTSNPKYDGYYESAKIALAKSRILRDRLNRSN